MKTHRPFEPLPFLFVVVTLLLPATSPGDLSDRDIAQLFGGEPPQVEIDAREAVIQTRGGWPTPSYLSTADGVAVTVSTINEVNFRKFGELLIWDLSQGRLRHALQTPARIAAVVGVPGSGKVAVVGGPMNKDLNLPFIWVVDLRTGVKTHAFEPRHHGGGGLSVRVSPDGQKLVVRNDSNFNAHGGRLSEILAYDLENPDAAPHGLTDQFWDQLPPPSSETAGDMPGIPSWLPHVGDIDGGFALAVDENHVTGLWRVDTWERVSAIGDTVAPWQSWVAAPDGMHLLSWRHDHGEGFSIWDFERFRVITVEEPGFRPELAPAFSADGRFVRYKRAEADSGEIEIVSRDWAAGTETVAHRLPADDFEIYYDAKIRGVFSDDGQQLLLARGEDKAALRVSWDQAGESRISQLEVNLKEAASISDDGSMAVILGEREDRDDDTQFPVYEIDLNSGQRVERWEVITVGHPPELSAANDPDTGRLAISQYTVGASLGYYGGDVVILDGNQLRNIPGFHVDGHMDPLDREANAWSVDFLRIGSGGPLLGIYANNGRFITYDPRRDQVIHQFKWDDYNYGVFASGKAFPIMTRIAAIEHGRVFLPVLDGGIRVVDLLPDGTTRRVADLWSLSDRGWFAVTPEGYYAISPGSGRQVFFRHGDKTFSFEQFDPFLNRPDKVAEGFGANPGEVESLRRAYDRRLRMLGIRDPAGALDQASVPGLEIQSGTPLTLDAPAVTIPIAAEARNGATIERILVSANGVPVFGVNGMRPGSGPGATIREEIDLALVPGENRIRVSVRDSRGIESRASTLRIHRGGAARQKPDLYLLGVGVSDYANDVLDLTFPTKDVRDLAEVLRETGAGFDQIHETILTNADATREGVLAARQILRQSRPSDRLIVFVAGHGVLAEDYRYFFCTHEFDPEAMSQTGLSFEELESLFDGVPARERLLLMDTCQAGAVDAELLAAIDQDSSLLPEGVRAVASRALRSAAADTTAGASAQNQRFVEELFTDLRRGTGATVLSAAGGLEFALESADWSNGVFTYSIIEALRNSQATDRDRDGALRASELVAHVSNRVIELTEGLQNPNMRSVNLAVDFPVVELRAPGEPRSPHAFLERYLSWSSSQNTPLNRILGMFEARVAYFDKDLDHAGILADIEEYNAKYDDRTYILRPGAQVSTSNGGRNATIDYVMDFKAGYFAPTTITIPGQGPVESSMRAYRDGTLKMRMELAWDGVDWRIVGLGTRP